MMNQLAYETSFHPGSFQPTFNGHPYNPQGYPQAWQPQGNQAFADPGQQRQYHDGASDFQRVPGGSMVQPAFASPPTNNPYTTAPYNHSVPAQAPLQNPSVRQSTTPPQRASPNAATQSQPSSQTPPTKYPMAAPPLPQTPANQQHQQQTPAPNSNNTVGSPTTPQSPGSQSREQQRIAILLSINIDLLAEVSRLQSIGQGGAISPQQLLQLQKVGGEAKMASEDYIQCLRRVQANLAYMMPKAQPGQHNESKALPGPAHMTAPPHLPQLKDKYEQLKEVFPDWPGYDHRSAQSGGGNSASPRSNAQMGNVNGMTPTTAQA